MKIIHKVAALALILVISGCASVAGDNNKIVRVTSKPEGAKVYVNNNPVGITPTRVAINNTWSPTLITFRKKGYEESSSQVNTSFQTIGLLNLFFWPGFIVDAATGNTMKVSPESRTINADLTAVA